MNGWKAFAAWIKGRTEQERKLLEPESDNLKKAAKDADAKGANK
jgi:Holliday junction resolvase RusA-like endonuclease